MKTFTDRVQEVEEANGGFLSPALSFKAIKNPLHKDRDIHALLYLSTLIDEPVIQGADHDVIYLGGDADKLAETLTDEQILELIRCGIRYSPEFGSLTKYV